MDFITHVLYSKSRTIWSGADDPKEDHYYIINFTSDQYTIQQDVIIDSRIISLVKQVANDCYLRNLRKG